MSRRNWFERAGVILAMFGTLGASEALGYCTSNGSNANYEWIGKVGVDAFSNTSASNGGYADFSAKVVDLSVGSHGIVLTPGFSSSATYMEYWKVWIDFNGDQQFTDNEMVYGNQSNGTVSGTFTVPDTANPGFTGMRVSMRYGSAPTPCGTFTYGEVEDYTANLIIVDTNPPTVVTRSPASAAVDVGVYSPVVVTFSENVNPQTVNNDTISVVSSAGVVAGVVSLSGKVATFTPSHPLDVATAYTVTVRAGVQDFAGNALAQDDVWSFTTQAPDVTPPTITGTSPVDNATNVSPSKVVEVYFSEPIDPASVDATTFYVSDGGIAVPGWRALANYDRTVQFFASAPYGYSKTLVATITSGVKDHAGNAMQSDYSWSFTTQATPPPPYCTSYSTNYSYMWISSVKVGSYTLSRVSNPQTGYVNSTSTSFNLSRVFSNLVTLKPAFVYSYDTVYWRIFIDWNQDGVFGSDEIALSGYGTSTVSSSITVPANALSGTTRMRVSARIPSYAPACGSFTTGMVEDFSVFVYAQ